MLALLCFTMRVSFFLFFFDSINSYSLTLIVYDSYKIMMVRLADSLIYSSKKYII